MKKVGYLVFGDESTSSTPRHAERPPAFVNQQRRAGSERFQRAKSKHALSRPADTLRLSPNGKHWDFAQGDAHVKLSPEELAGWQFLQSCKQVKSTLLPSIQLSNTPSILLRTDLVWWHYDSSISLPLPALDPNVIDSLRSYVERGGSLFLSLLASQYVFDLGVEEVRPNILEKGQWNRHCWSEKYPDIRGLSSFQGHPIFNGLHGAVYTWSPKPESNFAAAFYEAPALPKNGKVVAVEREYIKLNEDWRVAVEYKLGKGRILTVGSFMFFADEENRFRPHLEFLTENCLAYLTSAAHELNPLPEFKNPQTYWSFEPRTVRFTQRKPSKPILSAPANPWHSKPSGLSLGRERATDNFFDVGGRRILIMGSDASGIKEVWAHPLRILKNVKVGFRIGNRETVWTDTLQPQITVRPESLTRKFNLDGVTIEETTFASLSSPCGAMHFEVTGSESVEIVLTASIDLRIMWPLSERATGSLSYCWDEWLQGTVVVADAVKAVALLGGSLQPAEYIIGRNVEIKEGVGRFVGVPTDGVQVAVGLRYAVGGGTTHCTIAFAGSSVSEREATAAYRRMCSHPSARLDEQAKYFKSLLASSSQFIASHSQLLAPNSELMTAFSWALVATDRFFVETPGVGASLMAGYSTTQSGWNGGHTISGRPGYAWYFGRDSVWTALAMLAYGDFAKVRSVLEFLGTYQDITGKIAHEITTSGHVHYDAADATPLYIILMGRYLRASGDKRFVRQEFPRLREAIDFCFSTDTDGDHLIENTNVGHGWIESGPLFPTHAELYLNACWCTALEEAAFVAERLKRKEAVRGWRLEAKRIRRIINERFWNPATGFYNFARNADGTFNTARTILPTVAMYLGLTDPEKATQCLREIASEKFSSDWGVRMIANDDPMYNPEGYHYGSIWPLFTGWTALAELKYGLREEALKHLTDTLMLSKRFALGYIPEVLHGERRELAGVCPHQAWSEALAVLGMIEMGRARNRT